jgi:hypothetical protein
MLGALGTLGTLGAVAGFWALLERAAVTATAAPHRMHNNIAATIATITSRRWSTWLRRLSEVCEVMFYSSVMK